MANTSGSQLCGICQSPIRAEIETALDKKESLRSIAARSGHSRASLSRHNRRCRGRQAIAEYKTHGVYDPFTHRIFIQWPDSEPYLYDDVEPVRSWDHRRPVRPEEIIEVLLVVEYAKPHPGHIPKPATENPEHSPAPPES